MKKYLLLIMFIPLFFGCPADNDTPVWGYDYTTIVPDISGLELQYNDINSMHYTVKVYEYHEFSSPTLYYDNDGDVEVDRSPSSQYYGMVSIPNVNLPSHNAYQISVGMTSNDCSRGCVGSCPPPNIVNPNNYGKPEFYDFQDFTSNTRNEYTHMELHYVSCN